MYNCIDHPCKYLSVKDLEHFCILHNNFVQDDIDETGCIDFVLAKTCLDCIHRRETIYESGIIDDIEYRCEFQGRTVVYDDLKPGLKHYSDIPECSCNKFELAYRLV